MKRKHTLSVQYQIGKKHIYSNTVESETENGITIQQVAVSLMTVVANLQLIIKDKKIITELTNIIIKLLFRQISVCNMAYIAGRDSQSFYTKRSVKSKFNGERIDFVLRTTIVPFKSDNSIVSRVIEVIKSVLT